jgi:hypothetical protein
MRVDDLTGALLDLWVGRAEGHDVSLVSACGMSYCHIDHPHDGPGVYQPTENRQIISTIQYRQLYLLYPRYVAPGSKDVIWLAEAQLNPAFQGIYADERAEIALCRLRVAERYGAEVGN